jgi:putative flippase GtrA
VIRHFFTPQFLAFLVVGTTAAFINWSSRILFSFWLTYPIAVFIAYLLALACAFILNKYYVFPKSDRPLNKQMRDFFLTNIAFLPVVWSAAIMLAKFIPHIFVTQYTEEIAHAIAIAIPMFATFLIYKFIAFKV